MFVRCAYFEGTVHTGEKDRFERLVMEQIAPKMLCFPAIRRLEFYFSCDFETPERNICLCIEHTYDSREDIDAAITSDARAAMQADLEELLALFEGRVYHVNNEVLAVRLAERS